MKKNLLTMMLCCLPLLAWAQNETFDADVPCGDGVVKLTFNVPKDNPQKARVSACPKSITGDLVIPAKIKDSAGVEYTIDAIEGHAFENCTGLTSVEIRNNLFALGAYSFKGCTSLRSVLLPDRIDWIGWESFSDCTSLQTVRMPLSGVEIDGYAFAGCSNLVSIIIPENLGAIKNGVFSGCSNLTSITLPSSVTTIADNAFEGCNNLNSVVVKQSAPVSINADCFPNRTNTTLYVPEGSKSVYQAAAYWNEFKEINEAKVLTIDMFHRWDGCTASSTVVNEESGWIHLNETLQPGNAVYGDPAVYYLNYADLTGYNQLLIKGTPGTQLRLLLNRMEIGYGGDAFGGLWEELNPVIGEDGSVIVSIGGYEFVHLNAIKIGYDSQEGVIENLMLIKRPTIYFADAKVKAICVANWDTNGDGELSEDEAALVTDLGEVFKGNTEIKSFKELRYFTGLTSIGHHAFYDCSGLTSVTIPNTVTTIDYWAFGGCGLTSINIPNTITWIRYWAFAGCEGLTSVIIPKNVTSIDNAVFAGCNNLTSLTVESGNAAYDSRDNCNAIIETTTNKLKAGCKNMVIPEGVTAIGSRAFNGSTCLTSLNLPCSLTTIEEGSFAWCWMLPSITIPANVTSIGSQAFIGCSHLTEVLSMIREPFALSTDCWEGVYTDDIPLYVPKGTKQLYEATEGWNVFKNIIEKDDAFFVDNAVYVNDTVARIGGKMTLSLKMKNTAAIRGFQFDLYLPEGVTVAKSSKGKILGALSEGRLPDEDEHSLTFSEQPDGAIRFLCSSQYDETFTGNDGEIVTLQLNVAEDVAEGEYEIQLKNMKLTESDIEKHYDTALLRSRLTVMSIVLGDINSDKQVDVSDYTGVANHIHGATPNGFVFMAADVDENNTIDVSDYTGIANIIHTGNIYGIKASREMSRSPKKENTDLSGNDNVIYVESFAVTPGTPTTISIKMKNTAAIRGFQFDIYLPEGMTVVKSSKGRIQGALSAGRLPEDDEHELTFSERPDGAIRFLCSSQYDETFTGTDGEIATLQVNVAEGMADGNYPLLLKNMKLTETDIRNYYETDEVETTVSVLSTAEVLKGDVTGEGNVTAADVTALVNYILGRGTLANEPAAYVNDDDKIDIADVTALIELVK